MLIVKQATIEEINKINDYETLTNLAQHLRYSFSRFAKGKGSKRYCIELSCYIWNLVTYRRYNEQMYKDIADKCAINAEKLLAKYGKEIAQ